MRNLFKRKPYRTIECGGFIANFFYKEANLKRTYLEIKTISNVWSMRIAGNTYTYGYLLASAEKGLTEQIHGFAAMQYILSEQITKDQGLLDDVTRSIKKWKIRMEKKAVSASKNISEFEELATQHFMEESIKYTVASSKERKIMDEVFQEQKTL